MFYLNKAMKPVLTTTIAKRLAKHCTIQLAVAIHKKCQLKKKRIKIITDNGCLNLRTGNMGDSSHVLS